ncbi:MAG: hypothetical protein JF888_09765 [Candidatus Dormibacteraeota bacterium]|uniref:Uncharacterized protein n=1 Tax=Candidatus Dormiibacter inghamiae TaxID=3127013 RepID=A0A934KIR9_9BACT|nr:hypothetical protein [Candidatus Dormibacteraeota bacterium]MBJ7606724.1 hypothetical protein [Candidatus Dormibacteraeota bacterium]
MSTRKGKPSQSEPPLIQKLLLERRELLVSCERLKLELAELRGARAHSSPPLRRLEQENQVLRSKLAAARRELDEFRAGVELAVAHLKNTRVDAEAETSAPIVLASAAAGQETGPARRRGL